MTRTRKTSAVTLACLLFLTATNVLAESPAPATHTATIYLQVLPPPGSDAANFKQEDITRFINRQILFIKSDSVIDRILLQDELQHDLHDPASNKKSRWLTENIADARKHLRDAIEIVPHPNSDVFTLKFTAADRLEAARILNAIARVYRDYLLNDQQAAFSRSLENTAKQLEIQEQEVHRLETTLTDFRRANNVDALGPTAQTDLSVIIQLELDIIKAQQKEILVGSRYEALKKQSDAGPLKLSADAEHAIESDPRLAALEQAQLQLELDQAALPENAPAEPAAALNRKLAFLAKKSAERRAELTAAATVHMQQQAEDDLTQATLEAEALKKFREAKKTEYKDVTRWLDRAHEMTETLNTQKAVLAKLREQFAAQKLQTPTEQIRLLGGEATPPD